MITREFVNVHVDILAEIPLKTLVLRDFVWFFVVKREDVKCDVFVQSDFSRFTFHESN